MEPLTKRVLRNTTVFDKIPVSSFEVDQAKSVGEVAKNRLVTVHEEIAGGGKTWSRISTQEDPPAIKGIVASDRLGDAGLPVLNNVTEDQVATMAVRAAQEAGVSAHYLLALAHELSGLKNDFTQKAGKPDRIGPLRFTGDEWSAFLKDHAEDGLTQNSLRDPVSQFYAAAVLARATIDGLREAMGEFPTVAQLRLAWVPSIGLKGVAHMLAKPEAKIDAALADFLKPADPAAVTAILDSDPEIFHEGGQPRTIAQAVDALGVRLNKSLAPTARLIDDFFKANPDEDPSSVVASDSRISKDAIELIIEHEVSSRKVYDKKYRGAIWPGLQSGVTVGIGYDVGWQSAETVKQDFTDILDPAELAALLGAVGKKGGAAQAHLAQLKGKIDISYDDALKVFERRTIPVWTALVEKKLKNTDALHPHSLGALVSLVYNRGAGGFNSAKPRFRHMVEIRKLMETKTFPAIPEQFSAMKVLWQGKGVPGLLRRRDEEAALFKKGLQA